MTMVFSGVATAQSQDTNHLNTVVITGKSDALT